MPGVVLDCIYHKHGGAKPEMTKCQKPGCTAESVAWYRLTEGGPARLVEVCAEHASEIRSSVQPWQIVGRGRMHNGIAEGSGR